MTSGQSQLVRGEREPLEEAYSPTASSVASDFDVESIGAGSGHDRLEDDGTDDDGASIRSRRWSRTTDTFDVLRDLLQQVRVEPSSASSLEHPPITSRRSFDTMSLASAWQQPEMQQLRSSISSILAHLFKLATFIRQPIPQDRLKRSSKIDVEHFKDFDLSHVKDCFPTAPAYLQERLGRAITRRRQRLIYDRRYHEKLSKPHQSGKPQLTRHSTNDGLAPGTVTAPATVVLANLKLQVPATQIGPNAAPPSTTMASTRASEFIQPLKEVNNDKREPDYDALSVSTAASFAGANDVVHIPPRPHDEDGAKLEEFECPFCFHLQEIRSDRVWK